MFVMIIPLLTIICLLSFIFEFFISCFEPIFFFLFGWFLGLFDFFSWCVHVFIYFCCCCCFSSCRCLLALLLFCNFCLFPLILFVASCLVAGNGIWIEAWFYLICFVFLVLFFGWYDYLFDIDISNWSIRNTLVCCILSHRVCVCSCCLLWCIFTFEKFYCVWLGGFYNLRRGLFWVFLCIFVVLGV